MVDRLGRVATYLLPAVASALVVYLCLPFLRGEISVAWDEIYHQATEQLTAEMIRDGHNPFGLLPTMTGYPGFRFYQSLQYLLSAVLQLSTGAHVTTVHNWLMVALFALTPWTYRKFCLSLGLSPFAAGAAGLLHITSINGTSNSFESYFECAFLTQVLASVILPLALASLVTLVREGRGPVRTGVLMALTVMAHAAYAVYASLAAVLVVLVFLPRRIKTWLLLGAAAVLALVLSAGWALPFVHYQSVDKPVTDAVARANRTLWFNGLDPGEMGRFLVGGRLLDGGSMDGSSDASVETHLNMTPTRQTRFPFLTVLTGLGLILALIGGREPRNRLLIGGFAFGVLLMLGADDFPSFYGLPVFSKLQAFRVSYFIELFAIALGGMAVSRLGSLLIKWSAKVVPAIVPKLVSVLLVIAATSYVWWSTVDVVTPFLDTWDLDPFDRVSKVIEHRGTPNRQDRTLVKFRRPGRKFRFALEHWIEIHAQRGTVCNHWISSSPTVNLHLCGPLGAPWTAPAYTRLFGVRYLVVGREEAPAFVGKDSPLRDEYRQLGRVGRLTVIEDKRVAMLHEIPGRRVLVIGTPAQWYWLTKSWVARHSKAATSPATPWPLLGTSAALDDEALLDAVDAVMYLDDRGLERDRPRLEAIAASGKPLALSRPIEGLTGKVLGVKTPPWDRLLGSGVREAAGAKIKRLDRGAEPDRLRYRVETPSPTLLVLSMQHFEDWQARADGRPLTVLAGGPDLVAVIAPAGEYQLEFSYEWTAMETATFWISAIGWLATIGFGLFLAGRGGWRFVQKRRKKKP